MARKRLEIPKSQRVEALQAKKRAREERKLIKERKKQIREAIAEKKFEKRLAKIKRRKGANGIGRAVGKGVKFLEGGLRKGIRLPPVKKLTREQIAQKLLERRSRTQARIERAKILRTPIRLR